MENQNTQAGFTLIEVLVVILILAILAAIALPQYQKAVAKSYAIEATTLLKSIYQAADVFYLTNSTWPDTFEKLEVTIPWTETTKADTGLAWDTRSNQHWSLQLYREGSASLLTSAGVEITSISGPYAGAGFGIWKRYTTNSGTTHPIPEGVMLCIERRAGGITFEKPDGQYCEQLFKGKRVYRGNFLRFYTLP